MKNALKNEKIPKSFLNKHIWYLYVYDENQEIVLKSIFFDAQTSFVAADRIVNNLSLDWSVVVRHCTIGVKGINIVETTNVFPIVYGQDGEPLA